MSRLSAAAFVLLLVFAMGWAGESDLVEAQREQAVYCQTVLTGASADYKPEVDCPVPGDSQ